MATKRKVDCRKEMDANRLRGVIPEKLSAKGQSLKGIKAIRGCVERSSIRISALCIYAFFF